MSRKTYYNFLRDRQPNKVNPDPISGPLRALKDKEFLFRIRVKDKYKNDGENEKIVSRKLVQIFFYQPEAIHSARRFIAGHALILDSIFNTNNLCLPFLVAVGETNSRKTFPIAFSYCPDKTTKYYNFFFNCLKRETFIEDISEPAVVVADQASGLISSFDTHKAISNSVLQICNWHVIETIALKFRRADRYPTEEIDGVKDEKRNKIKECLED